MKSYPHVSQSLGEYSRRVLKNSAFCRILLGRVLYSSFKVTIFLLSRHRRKPLAFNS